MSKNWIYSWQWKSSRIRQQFYRWDSFAMNMDTCTSGSTVEKPYPTKNGIRIQCNTENFDPIVVPGLSASSASSLPSSTSMTPSRQEIDHPTSFSSSSTSTPMTSSTEIDHSDHLQQSCQAKVWIGKYGEIHILLQHQKSCWINQPKLQNQIKMRITNRYGEARIQTYQNGCKNSERILWMTEFLNAETHTQVLLMNHL